MIDFFDEPELEVVDAAGLRLPSTSESFAFLKTKRVGDVWFEGQAGRYLYHYGPQGVTVFDTDRWR